MSIKLELGATYDGMELCEVYELVKELKSIGFSDDTINELPESRESLARRWNG